MGMGSARTVHTFQVASTSSGLLISLDGEWYRLPSGSHAALEYAARADKAHHCTDATHDHTA